MIRKDKKAMALLFDSLVFLTIISVVGAALMGSVLLRERSQDTGDYIRSVHEVALRCSFKGEGTLSLLDMREAASEALLSNESKFQNDVAEQLSIILEGYLSPLYIFNYEVGGQGTQMSFGDERTLSSENIFVSCIDAEGGITFTLRVAYA